jgi:protease-4
VRFARPFLALLLGLAASAPSGCDLSLTSDEPEAEAKGPTAVLLDVDGPLPSFPSQPGLLTPFATSQHRLEELLDRAAADIMVQEVVVRFGTPQIGWARASEIAAAVKRLVASGKPVTCHLEAADNMTYWIAARSCPRVTVAPGGGVDLVGLSLEAIFVKDLLTSLGITADMLHVGKYKDAADALTGTEMSPESREAAESLVAALHERLVIGIAEGRKKDKAAVEKLIDEGPYTAKQAVAAGLADAVLTLGGQLEKLRDKYAGGVVDDYGEEPAKPLSFTDLLSMLGGGAGEKAEAKHPRIAIVPAVGPIVGGGGGGMLDGMEIVDDLALAAALSDASRDDSIQAIVIRVDSPGGSALASDNLYEAVRAAAQRKPVVASMGDVAASGGYYLAAAATEVFASDTTLTGSIGVVGGKVVVADGLAKAGVATAVVERGRRASIASPFRPFTEDERALVTRQMQEAYDLFVARVAEGRSLAPDAVRAAAEGRVWTGGQALGLKLVDRMGTLRDAVERARGLSGAKGAPAELYPPPQSLMELLAEQLSQQETSATLAVLRRHPAGRRALALGGLLLEDRVLAYAPLSIEVR